MDKDYLDILKKGAESNLLDSKNTYLETVRNENASVTSSYSYLGNIVTLLGGFSLISLNPASDFEKVVFFFYLMFLIASGALGFIGRSRIQSMWEKHRKVTRKNFENWSKGYSKIIHLKSDGDAESAFKECATRDDELRNETTTEIAEWPMALQTTFIIISLFLLLILVFS